MPACLQELVDRVRSGGGQPGGSAGGSPTGGDFENLAWFGARLGRRPGVDELRDVSSLLGVLGVDVLPPCAADMARWSRASRGERPPCSDGRAYDDAKPGCSDIAR